MFDLSRLYHPLTATPLGRQSYAEAVPCSELKPWVRCFWYSQPAERPATLVIPDTCMDLMFIREGTQITCCFCALCDRTFASVHQSRIIFAVRFYPWAAALFANEPLTDTLNLSCDAHLFFPSLSRWLLRMLSQTEAFEERCRQAEAILCAHLERRHMAADFGNAMHAIIQSQGRHRVRETAQSVQLSTRQLERLFECQTGASPKKLTDMIRYQSLWHEAVFSPRFDVQDAVCRYGFTDQSHLLRQFKQYHSLTLTDALRYARQHVAFIQYSQPASGV